MNQQDFIKSEEWAIRVSRLLELISIEIQAAKQHTDAKSPFLLIEQHVELKNRYLDELNKLMATKGLSLNLGYLDQEVA